MGTATIAGYTLNSIVDVKRSNKRTNAEHEIPGTASIVQAVGRKRDIVTITGILNPTSEIVAVGNLLGLSNTSPFSAVAVTDVAGTDWVGGVGNTFFLQSVQPQTEKGTKVPWGKYVIELIEVS